MTPDQTPRRWPGSRGRRRKRTLKPTPLSAGAQAAAASGPDAGSLTVEDRAGSRPIRERIGVMPVYSYDPPERFVAGTVGQPGERTFYLQATVGTRVTSVALEKGQVSQLAERLEELLDEVARRTGAVSEAGPEIDDGPLDLPLTEDF